MKQSFLWFFLSLMLSSCSLLKTAAVNSSAEMISSGSNEVLTEGNWQNFDKTAAPNLKLIEGLWFANQDNETLLYLLIKGYAGYAFASLETKAMQDVLEEKDESPLIDQVILTYEKSIYYGLKLLELRGVRKVDFYNKSFGLKLKKVFDEKLHKKDLVAIFYFAQALGGSINIQRKNIKKMAYLHHVKEALSWVCNKKPSIERGGCKLFNAIILASTPTLLGGDQEIAKKLFKKIIKDQPYNLLARLSYIQYHLLPMLEEDLFESEMKALKTDIDIWYSFVKGSETKKTRIYYENRNFNLFNSIAREKYNILVGQKDELF